MPGKDGIDADDAAAEMASTYIYEHFESQDAIYAVEQAGVAYVNDHVTCAQLVAQLKRLLNTYQLVWRSATSAGGSPLAEQGILESIDEKNETFMLKSTVYKDQRSTVSFSDVGEIDESR